MLFCCICSSLVLSIMICTEANSLKKVWISFWGMKIIFKNYCSFCSYSKKDLLLLNMSYIFWRIQEKYSLSFIMQLRFNMKESNFGMDLAIGYPRLPKAAKDGAGIKNFWSSISQFSEFLDSQKYFYHVWNQNGQISFSVNIVLSSILGHFSSLQFNSAIGNASH